MVKLTKRFSINAIYPVFFILLSSFILSKNLFAHIKWNREFTTVTYNSTENSITIRFKVYDYYFGANNEGAYLFMCDFYYTIDGRRYNLLMRAEAKDQSVHDQTELKMSTKENGTLLQFLGCYKPANKSIWRDNIKEVAVEVKNDVDGQLTIEKNNKKIKVDKYIAYFTVKWFLGNRYRDVKRIRLNGAWMLKGRPDYYDDIANVYYEISDNGMLKSTVNQSTNKRVKVAANVDAIVVPDTDKGENIKVYNKTGVEVQ